MGDHSPSSSLATPPSQPGPGESPRTIALVLSGLFVAGAATGALTLLLPHPASYNDAALWTNIGAGLVVGLLLAALAGRLPIWAIHLAVVLGTLIVARAVYEGGDTSGFYSLWYVWVGVFAFLFFGRRWGLIHLAIVAAAYAWVLTEVGGSVPIAQWVMTIGTMGVAGGLVDVLAGRVRRRAAQADSRARALEAVSEVAHELARRGSPGDAAETVCAAAVEITGAQHAALLVPAADGRGLTAAAATLPTLRGVEIPFLAPHSAAVEAFSTGEGRFVGDGRGDPRVNQELLRRFGAAALMLQPVLREGTSIGVLVAYWDRPKARLSWEVELAVELLAVEASVSMERTETLARLERVARTDDLTGLPNRRAWGEQLTREIARAVRQGSPLSVAILDLDHFKAYNDRHGHLIGDQFLKRTAAAWSELIRDTDLLARYGGEEFALALPDTEPGRAAELLERLREATPEGERTSAGVVLWDEEEDEDELTARADEALYAAKHGGRDRTVIG